MQIKHGSVFCAAFLTALACAPEPAPDPTAVALDRYRLQQKTPWQGLYLAGDWTATEWPSTM